MHEEEEIAYDEDQESTAVEALAALTDLMQALVRTPDPSTDVFTDDVSLGCLHPETAATLVTKINNAWSGGRRDKIQRVVTRCVTLSVSLCQLLGVDPRDPSK